MVNKNIIILLQVKTDHHNIPEFLGLVPKFLYLNVVGVNNFVRFYVFRFVAADRILYNT